MTLGDQLKSLRAKRGLSQPELAELAGIEQSYLSKLENDKSLPSNEVLRKLLNAFSVTLVQLLQPLEQQYIKDNLMTIADVEHLYQQQNEQSIAKQRYMLYLSSLLIVIATTLFYTGFSKLLFNETRYEYVSEGIVLADEPINIFENWRDLIDSSEPREHREQMQKQKVIMAKRTDIKRILTSEDRGGDFETEVTGGRRLFYIDGHGGSQVPRPINAWLQIIGVLLFASGIMGFVLERKLFKR
ncbi:helix-turn-helix domain-containing protein [Litorilituus lipolyticus]|uniref:XRE family transcriptional regulator n=1 Tax=Litorilituus lipolyticus TaxID=2491017 RepID=A0A502KNV5_9GAMM|nr:helix-turn-helix transcriptional regulator [Litorilituus lipolyticus]TPH13400.1 XRE family transcriptional regulator [Litorilituus lipolyticus]